MTPSELATNLRSRINPLYADQLGTESYERRVCAEMLEKLVEENAALLAANQDSMDHYNELREEFASIKAQEPIGYAVGINSFDGCIIRSTPLGIDYVPVYRAAGAQPAPKQQPFGYVSEHNCQGPFQFQFHKESATVYTDNCKSITPVYAAPVQAQERKPLTDEQIEKLREKTFSTNNPYCPVDSKSMRKAARAIEAAHDIKEPAEPVAFNESECNRLERERDAAVRLAAERLEQMNADRKQYLDVRDARDTLKNLIKEARKIIRASAHARSSHSDWLNRTKDLS